LDRLLRKAAIKHLDEAVVAGKPWRTLALWCQAAKKKNMSFASRE
jgi:hypothetical protein